MTPSVIPLARAVAIRTAEGVAAAVLGVVLVAVLVHAAPGDALSSLPDGEALRPELATRWGLDRPLPAAVFATVRDAAAGDLGTSWVVRPGAPVAELARDAAAASAARVAGAAALSLAVGFAAALGVGRAAARWSALLPVFAVAHLTVAAVNAVTWTGLQRGWWGRPDWFALPVEAGPHRELLAVVVLAMGTGSAAWAARDLRRAADHVAAGPLGDAARGRGDDLRPLVRRHLVVPALQTFAAALPGLVAATVIAEHVLLLPGAGAMFWDAALARDHDLSTGLALAGVVGVQAARTAADLAAAWWDPRLREASP
jgi:ABC-type dipeptide/oligopeptide/nickel transport system permease component